jgi:hypothetical protein
MTETTTPTPAPYKVNQAGVPEHIAKLNNEHFEAVAVPDHIAKLNEKHGSFSNYPTENIADEVGSSADERIANDVLKEKEIKKEPQPTKKEKKTEPLLKEIKYNGKVEKYDVNNHDQVIKDVQIGKAATKKFEEAASLKNEAIQIANLINTKPDLALKQLGWDESKIEKWATDYLYEKISYQNMTPKERELLSRERALQEAETRRQLDESAKRDQTQKEKFTKTDQEIQTMLMTAWDNRKDLPKNSQTAIRALYYMKQAVEHGIPIDANDCLAQVKKDLREEQKAVYSDFDEDSLLEFLGDDVVKKINKGLVKKLKKEPVKIQSNSTTLPKSTKTMGDFSTKEDFFNYLQSIRR